MRASVLGRDAALADLDTMLAIVRDVHPDPSPRFAVLRDSLAQAWPTSITRARLWTDLSRVLASMDDGHTSLWLANEEVNAAVAAGQRAFPLGVTHTDDGFVVSSVVGEDSARLHAGDLLLRINDEPVSVVAQRLGRAVPAELPAFRERVVLSAFGPRLWLDGVRPPYRVTVLRAGTQAEIPMVGATLADFQRRAPAPARAALTARRNPDSLLVLDFTSMGGDASALRATLDSTFDAAKREGVRAIVVDLRRNGGGNSAQGITLLSYITGKPLSQGIRKEWKSSARYRAHFSRSVSPLIRWLPFSWIDGSMGGFFSVPVGSIATMQLPTAAPPPANARRLERPLCVLIGHSTFSSAMMLANTVRQSNVGTLIGEPTGEPPNSHGEVFAFQLPNSGLAGQVSSARFVLEADTAAAHRGVLPHVPVIRTSNDVVQRRDPVMERALACGRDPALTR